MCVLCMCRVADKLPQGPWQTDCAPASVGEFWFNDWIAEYLRDCKGDCKNIEASPGYGPQFMMCSHC